MKISGILCGAVLGLCVMADPGETRQLKPVEIGRFPQKDGRVLVLESLGRPLPAKKSNVEFVTEGKDGERIAWAVSRATIEHFLLGYGEKSGLHKLDLTQYFGPHSYKPVMLPAGDCIYILAGNRGPALIRYHIPTKTSKVLKKYTDKLYYLQAARDSKGRIFWATYPKTEVIGVDPATDQVLSLGRMTTDPKQSYALNSVVDDEDVMFVPVGENYPEIYAVRLATGEKRMILSPEDTAMMQAAHIRLPKLVYHQGKVYFQLKSKRYLCTFDGLQACPEKGNLSSTFLPNPANPGRRFTDQESAVCFSEEGLVLQDVKTKKTRLIPLEGLPVVGHELYSVGGVRNNILFGSGIFPASVFGVDLKTLVSTDYGRYSRGGVQNYDIQPTEKGVLLASYVNSYFDFLDPDQPVKKGVNPRPVTDLRKFSQDRPIRMTAAGDGESFYVATMPDKNTLGGSIAQVNAHTGELRCWRNIIHEQSIMDVVVVPGTNLLFGCSCIAGGTGSVPSQKEAKIFLFDPEQGKVVWESSTPDKAPRCQGSMVTGDGKIAFVGAGGKNGSFWYLWDPATRSIVKEQKLSNGDLKWIFSEKNPVGPAKRNYFFAQRKLYEYDVARGTVLELLHCPDLPLNGYVTVAPDGYFYCFEECRLVRVRVY